MARIYDPHSAAFADRLEAISHEHPVVQMTILNKHIKMLLSDIERGKSVLESDPSVAPIDASFSQALLDASTQDVPLDAPTELTFSSKTAQIMALYLNAGARVPRQ